MQGALVIAGFMLIALVIDSQQAARQVLQICFMYHTVMLCLIMIFLCKGKLLPARRDLSAGTPQKILTRPSKCGLSGRLQFHIYKIILLLLTM